MSDEVGRAEECYRSLPISMEETKLGLQIAQVRALEDIAKLLIGIRNELGVINTRLKI